MRWLIGIAVFVVYPLVEIVLMVAVAAWTSWWVVIVAMLVGIVIGTVLMSKAGAGAARALQGSMSTLSVPAADVRTHAMEFTSGMLFAIPGFVSDVVAVLLIVPPTQRWVGQRLGDRGTAWLRRRGFSPVKVTREDGTTGTRISPGDIVEGEILDP